MKGVIGTGVLARKRHKYIQPTVQLSSVSHCFTLAMSLFFLYLVVIFTAFLFVDFLGIVCILFYAHTLHYSLKGIKFVILFLLTYGYNRFR